MENPSFNSDRKTAFFVVAVIMSVCATYFLEFHTLIFVFALLTSFGISFSFFPRVGVATVLMDTSEVSLAWGLVNYSLFMIISSLFILPTEFGDVYLFGMALAFAVSLLLTRVAPRISYRLGLNSKREGKNPWRKEVSIYNRIYFFFFVALFSLCFIGNEDIDRTRANKKEFLQQEEAHFYQQELWYPVISWNTEIIDGNTIYVVKSNKGVVGIYPSKYPDIRNINSKTQIKYLEGTEKSGFVLPKKLEIKN